MSVSFLKREGAPDIAYIRTKGENEGLPCVVFLSGFRSDMMGTKAEFLASSCARRGQPYLRFDYRGHGQSGGAFEDGTIGLWLSDALAAIDALTDGPLILVGSSMGGWLALLAALARKERTKGLVGLAAAPDFTREIPTRMNAAQKSQMDKEGFFTQPSDYGDAPLVFTRTLLEEGEAHCLLDAPVAIDCPVRLIQGMKDADVPWQTAHRISNAITGADKKVFLREDGDHRLSAAGDLALLEQLVVELSA